MSREKAKTDDIPLCPYSVNIQQLEYFIPYLSEKCAIVLSQRWEWFVCREMSFCVKSDKDCL